MGLEPGYDAAQIMAREVREFTFRQREVNAPTPEEVDAVHRMLVEAEKTYALRRGPYWDEIALRCRLLALRAAWSQLVQGLRL